jgi:hypothetical protein
MLRDSRIKIETLDYYQEGAMLTLRSFVARAKGTFHLIFQEYLLLKEIDFAILPNSLVPR